MSGEDVPNSASNETEVNQGNDVGLSGLENNQKTSLENPKDKKFYIFLGALAIIIILIILITLKVFANQARKKESIPQTIPSATPILTVTPTLKEEQEIPSITVKPTVTRTDTPVPTKKPTNVPTIILTPTIFGSGDPINEKHTCGSSDYFPSLPAKGEAPLFVALFPAGSTAQPESLEGYQWDFDNDGIWDTGVVNWQSNRLYEKPGTYEPKYRVRGSGGTWSKTCDYPYQVIVGEKNEFNNGLIAIDRLSVEVSISKANPSYNFPVYESKSFSGSPSRAFRPGFTISSKNNFVAVRLQNNGDGYGFIETGYDLREGTSFRVHLSIDLSKPNGIYTGNSLIQFTKDGKMQDGPRVTYKITLID